MTHSTSCLEPFWLEIPELELNNLILKDEEKIQIYCMCLYCKMWFGCPLVLRNTRSWRFQLSCKQSKCPGTAKTFQSPTQPMQRDHRERLWDYRKRERCLTSFQVFQLPAVPALESWLQLHGRPWARSTQARPSQISMPQRLWGG